MAGFESFAQVLEQKLRRKIEQEIRAEIATPTENPSSVPTEIISPLWTHLIGHLPPQHFTPANKGQTYHRLRPQPKPRPAHKLTAEQTQSFHFFKCHGSELANNFSKADLKSAFRKLALKLHPDQGGAADQFLSLKLAHENLQFVFGGKA